MGSTETSVLCAVERLTPILGDRLLTRDHPQFEAATRIWHRGVPRRPAVVARCRDAAEVRASVLAARELGLPLSVRGGGHDWAGRALVDRGLLLDLSMMRSAQLDPGTRTVSLGGGATAQTLLEALGEHGLATPTGTNRSVGMAGLTLGGGYGPLNGRLGLALDNLLSAQVVLADGREVTASPRDDAELFWALRGGGGNFGVVTRLTFQLHVLPQVLAGMIFFPLAQARDVLRGYRDLLATTPDDLTVMAGMIRDPRHQAMLFLAPCWSGPDLAQGERYVHQLQRLGTALMAQVGPAPYHLALGAFEGGPDDWSHCWMRSRWVPELTDAALDVVVEAALHLPSATSVLSFHHFHGASTRVGPADTAFGLRRKHFLVELFAAWEDPAAETQHREWANQYSERLAPFALAGGYPNLLGPDEQARVPASYGDNYQRLISLKRRYDPDHVFSAVPALGP